MFRRLVSNERLSIVVRDIHRRGEATIKTLALGLLMLASGCNAYDGTSSNDQTPVSGSVRLGLAIEVVAQAGAFVHATISYTPNGSGSRVVVAEDSVLVGTGTDTAFELTAGATGCLRDAPNASGAGCTFELALRLTRDGRLLDESVQQIAVTAAKTRIEVPVTQLFEVNSVRIDPANVVDLEPGDVRTFTATGLDRSGLPVSGKAALFSLVNGGVTVTAAGEVRAITAGPARIRATMGGRSADISLVVNASSVARIDLAPLDTLITIGGAVTYRATARAANGDVLAGRVITIGSSTSAASVVGTVATGVAAGQTTITARSAEGRAGAVVVAPTTLRVEAAPTIVVEPAALTFTTEVGQPIPAAQTINIRNGGGGTLGTLSIVGTVADLSVSFDRNTAPATLTVRPLTASAVTLSRTIGIRSSTPGVADVLVPVTIIGSQGPPILVDRATVVLDTLSNGTQSPLVSISVTTLPGRQLTGLSASATYLPSVTPWLTTLAINPNTTPATLTLRASAGTLPPGEYTADVQITAGIAHVPATVRVTMRVVAARRVIIEPKSVNFGTLYPTQTTVPATTVAVRSSSGVALEGLATKTEYISGASDWLNASLQSLRAAPSTTLQLTPRPFGFANGTYQARVIVTSTTLGAGPDTLLAQMTVRRDSLLLSPDSVSVVIARGSTVSRSVAIRAQSGDPLTLDSVSVSYDQPQFGGWIGNPVLDRKLLPANFSFAIVATNLPVGNYSARITARAVDGALIGTAQVVVSVFNAISSSSTITTFAGIGIGGTFGDNGPATSARLNSPIALAMGPDGSIYISTADSSRGRVRRVLPSGTIITVAGNGNQGCPGVTPIAATSAPLMSPRAGAVMADGSFYIADLSCGFMLRVNAQGVLSRVAGISGAGSVALASDGSVYYTENANNRVRRVDANGVISLIAGNGAAASSGDGGSALLAALNQPSAVAFGPDGSLYITENQGHRIRRVAPNGIISTVAGTGISGYTGNGGLATSARISSPNSITVDADGTVYFGEFGNYVVRRVGIDGIISTVAGTGSFGSTGDGGAAGSAFLSSPAGLVFASDGSLLIADQNNYRVRRIK